ncbi:MAG: GbpC/Spa domain-containing protein [Streptococcus sobrinus]
MGKKKLTQYSLLSGLVLTTLAAGQQVLADEATDTSANTATDNQASQVSTTGPQVKVIDQQTEGNKTTTTSEVTSPELTQAVNDVNSFNQANTPSTDNTNKGDTDKSGAQDANTTQSNVVVPPVTISQGETKTYDTVEEADAANKAQAQEIQNTLAQYQKDVADYKEKLANYNKANEEYVAAKAAYDEKVKAYNDYQAKVKDLTNPENAEVAKGLVFNNEPNAVVSVDGVKQYVTKEAQGKHVQDEILQQFNTDKYSDSDFTSENPYAPNEDSWFKMNVGDTVTATYTNLGNAEYLGTKIGKVVTTYKLTDSTSNDGSAIVKLYHDPTKTIFIGAQTSNDPSKAIKADIQVKFYDENGNLININGDNSVISLASLNHWTTQYGDHVEKVLNIGNNKFVAFNGSSIKLNADGAIYSPNDNEFVNNGAALNSDGENGWDKINADGEKRTTSSTYGAAAMTYDGEPFSISASGNNAEVPTAIWFAVNSFAVQQPGEAPVAPVMPKLDAAKVVVNRANVKQTVDNKTPEPKPGKPTPENPTTPETPKSTTPTPEKPATPVKPQAPSTTKEVVPKTETPTATSQRAQTAQVLPQTGDANSYGLAAFGAGIVAFSTLTLLGGMKRKED